MFQARWIMRRAARITNAPMNAITANVDTLMIDFTKISKGSSLIMVMKLVITDLIFCIFSCLIVVRW